MDQTQAHDFAKDALVSNILEQVYPLLQKSNSHSLAVQEENFKKFGKGYFQSTCFDELQNIWAGSSKDVLIETFLTAWRIFQEKPTEFLLDVSSDDDDDTKSFVTILIKDQPFLVDTVLVTLKKHNQDPLFLFHPVFNVFRNEKGALCDVKGPEKGGDQESLISFCLDNDKVDLEFLKQDLQHALMLVKSVVADFPYVQKEILKIASNYNSMSSLVEVPHTDFQEIADFLRWLHDGPLVVLGSRYFHAKTKINLVSETALTQLELSFELDPKEQKKSARGLFHYGNFQNIPELLPVVCHTEEPLYGTVDKNLYDVGTYGRIPLVSVSKSFQRSPVHRHSRIDSIEIVDMDENGTVFGVFQVIGIFSRDFFAQSPLRIPLLRHKISQVFERFGHSKQSYDGKYILNILKSISQDELFQLKQDQIYDICSQVFYLYNKLAVFMRHDPYGRFTSVMVYLPKSRYTPYVKELLSQEIATQLGGHVESDQVFLTEFPFARLIFVVSFHTPKKRDISLISLREKLEQLSRSWQENLEDLLKADHMPEGTLIQFPKAYENTFSPEEGKKDIESILKSIQKRNAVVRFSYKKNSLCIHVINPGQAISLSTLMPLWENFGLKIVNENSYVINHKLQGDIWLHSFECSGISHFDKGVEKRFTEAFDAVWNQHIDNDAFNQLILKTKLAIHEVNVLRAYGKAMKQMLLGFSLESLIHLLVSYPHLAEQVMDFFTNRHNPDLSEEERCHTSEQLWLKIKESQKEITSDTDERIFDRLLNVVDSTVRTNYYCCRKKGYISFKFNSKRIKDLPRPTPLYEIFVYSNSVEAVHLRAGKVSRGGVRWSDRLDDFRLETYSLMKAQTLKNSIIIPLGSKGGFICKNYIRLKQAGASSERLKQEVLRCYEIMIRGLLDLTDNWRDGECQHPKNVVCYDEKDPYLVVAADKGTGGFSDVANRIAAEYEFWLGDAFASGGSHGYDHKKMAITSKGAWVSLQHHFNSMHIDPMKVPFTVVGVGDMSGDVFGNGMLQSKMLCLVAAFNHEHIFIDPNPDPSISFEERQRLFRLPYSNWSNYNSNLLSEGGGVFSRSISHIPLNKFIRRRLGIPNHYDSISPHELIQFILKAPVDVIWFGGIGTYVKALEESHYQVDDRSNDDVRVDANDMEARVIIEGANLGMTQQARIEFAKKQGLINTDTIDNSAGVSCSDHEVNIKILLQGLVKKGKLSLQDRNDLLVSMQNDVVNLVLTDNLHQNIALKFMEYASSKDLFIYQALIHALEKAEALPLRQKGDVIPTDDDLAERRIKNKGLVRPELATLMAYTKINLYQYLLDHLQHEDAYFSKKRKYLHQYFPEILTQKFSESVDGHQLRKEIITTVLANDIVNHMGVTFVLELCQASSSSPVEVVEAYTSLNELFGFQSIWNSWQDPNQADNEGSYDETLYEFIQSVKQLTLVCLRNKSAVQNNWSKLTSLLPQMMDIFVTYQREYLALSATKRPVCVEIGPFLPVMLEFALQLKGNLSQDELNERLKTFWDVHNGLQIQIIYELANKIFCAEEWQREAKFSLLDDLVHTESQLAYQVFAVGGFSKWSEINGLALQKHKNSLDWINGAIANPYEKADIALILHALRTLKICSGNTITELP